MKAPKKICIIEYPDGLSRYWVSKKRDDVVATLFHEYLNKDALLEWAEAKKSELFNGEPTDVAAGINAGLDMIIIKLKSL